MCGRSSCCGGALYSCRDRVLRHRVCGHFLDPANENRDANKISPCLLDPVGCTHGSANFGIGEGSFSIVRPTLGIDVMAVTRSSPTCRNILNLANEQQELKMW